MSWVLRTAALALLTSSGLTGGCEAREAPMSIDKTGGHETDGHGVIAIEDATGLWQATSPDGRATCLIALSRFARTEDANSYGVHVEACAIQTLASAVGWRPVVSGFELIGPAGKTLAAFHRRDVDAFNAVEGGYRLERAPLA